MDDRPVTIDVFFPLPEGWRLCASCESMLARAGLRDGAADLDLDQYPKDYREEVERLGEWVNTLAARFGGLVRFRIHDPRAPGAMWKALHHGVRRYPSFVIAGQGRVTGWQREALESRIEQAILRGPLPASIYPRWLASFRSLALTIGQMFYGMTIYEMVRDLNKQRSQIERMFILITFGDLLGVPILPPYYTMRLLPYVVPNINAWKHSLLRERDLTDLCDQEIT